MTTKIRIVRMTKMRLIVGEERNRTPARGKQTVTDAHTWVIGQAGLHSYGTDIGLHFL